MDVQYYNNFIDSIVTTFSSALGSKPYRSGDFKKVTGHIRNPDALMGILTFSGSLLGAMLITFEEETVCNIYNALMYEETSEVDEDVKDAITEFLCMVGNGAKSIFADDQLHFDDPMVAYGSKIKFENEDNLVWLYVPMSVDKIGNFKVFIGLNGETV